MSETTEIRIDENQYPKYLLRDEPQGRFGVFNGDVAGELHATVMLFWDEATAHQFVSSLSGRLPGKWRALALNWSDWKSVLHQLWSHHVTYGGIVQRALVGALNHDPDTGVVVIENARIDRKDRPIASAIIERYATDPEPFLFSTGTGPATRRVNDVVLAISTNFGTVSEDILNRSLPIHLNPTGDVTERSSPIGNPKLEYLPQYRGEIAAEIHGMVKRWRDAGRPLDTSVRHPFSEWAATIGGILTVNGFSNFLDNYGSRKVADDPTRKGLGLLGAALPDGQWYRPDDWARLTAKLGLIKHIIPAGDRDGAEGHKRGIGVVLSAHRDETFEVETDSEVLRMRLQKKRGRFGSGHVHVRYRFIALERVTLEEDED